MNWPDPTPGSYLGDGQHATARERPETIEALREAVARCAGEGLAIYPQGGRTSLDYGGVPRRPGVALDTAALARIVDYPAADMTITVEAGITLAGLQAVLARHNQRLPLDAPRADRATLGGIYASNTSGPRRYGAGRPRDMIIGISFVAPDGRIIKGGGRVVKNVAGYDFPRLLTGSMGTLGVIAQVTLKVSPRPEASALAWFLLPTAGSAAAALDRMITSQTRPIALELLNRSVARRLGEPLGLPPAAWILVLGFEDNADSVAWQLDRIRAEFEGVAGEVRQGEEVAPVWSALVEFPADGPGPLTFMANLRPSGVVPFAARLDPGRWAIQAHAGNGIVHGLFLGEWDLEALVPELDRLRVEAVAQDGNLILPRCPTAAKDRLRVWGEPRGDWPLMEQIKAAIDPGGVMNPGRFVGTI